MTNSMLSPGWHLDRFGLSLVQETDDVDASIVDTIEAEAPDNEMSGAYHFGRVPYISGLPAQLVYDCKPCSGQKKFVLPFDDNALTLGTKVPASGFYEVRVFTVTGAREELTVRVNDGPPVRATIGRSDVDDDGDLPTPHTVFGQFRRGSNSIIILAGKGGSPAIDRVEIRQV